MDLSADSELPAGLSLSNSGTISGTPDGTGTFTFSIEATDANGAVAAKIVSILIYAPLLISTSTLPHGSVGASCNQYLSATGGREPYNWTISEGNLPAGLILSTSGPISEKPSVAGIYTFTIQVADANGTIVAKQFSIEISDQLMISTSSLPYGVIDMQYNASLNAMGGTPPYTWSIISGSLPGMNLDSSTGVISGIASATGAFTVTAQITDSHGVVTSKTITITINPLMPDLIITLVSGPEIAQPGQSVTISNSLRNQGVLNSEAFMVCIYLSPDPDISRSDILLATRYLCNGIESGAESTSDTANFVIPEIANGTYYIRGNSGLHR